MSGIARVVDGDTLDLAGRCVRLEGIDAPEAGQKCPGRYAGGLLGSWRCGRAATAALARLVDGHRARCESHEMDKYDRLIATCYVCRLDINAEMVRTGHPGVFVKYSRTYIGEEAAARRSKTGIWASRQPSPANLAMAHQALGDCRSEGCAIKGNISRRGDRIYLTPWSSWYAKVRIDASWGERWLCDEAQALAAGWRAARMR